MKKDFMVIIGGLMILVGWALAAFGFITGIGVLLYHVGVLEMGFAISAWIAFKVFITMVASGVFSLIFGFIIAGVSSKS